MNKLLVLTVLMALPVATQVSTQASAQVLAQAKPKAARDVCTPIGKTADGRLVYPMACDMMPVAPPAPAAAVEAPPPPEPEVVRSGIFGLSYTRKPTQ